MGDFFSKLSSYNIFNYLFPGALLTAYIQYRFMMEPPNFNILVGFFLVYFIGLVISRLGSLLFEWPVEKLLRLEKSQYSLYVKACKEDPATATIAEMLNVYRTLISLMFIVFFISVIFRIIDKITNTELFFDCVVSLSLAILFILSYKKQFDYVQKRVLAASACD